MELSKRKTLKMKNLSEKIKIEEKVRKRIREFIFKENK